MIVTIHQPEYLPCAALAAKVARADLFIVLDDVQFKRDSLQQRARVCDSSGALHWLTIPFRHRFPQDIGGVEIATPGWEAAHRHLLRTLYAKAPHREAAAYLVPTDAGSLLAPAVTASMRRTFEVLGVRTPMCRASVYDVDGRKGERVLALCRAAGATHYLAGRAGAAYLDRAAFADAGVEIVVSAVEPLAYPRTLPLPPDAHAWGLSTADAIAHLGPGAAAWLAASIATSPRATSATSPAREAVA